MPITLGKRQWAYLSVILLIVLPIIVWLAFVDRIYAAYLHEFVGPKLQQEFGFRAGTETIVEGKESFGVFVIQSVQPPGILAEAGFQSDDIPVGYKHGFESGFYQDLLWAKKGDPIEMWVVNINDARRGNWQRRSIRLHLKKRISHVASEQVAAPDTHRRSAAERNTIVTAMEMLPHHSMAVHQKTSGGDPAPRGLLEFDKDGNFLRRISAEGPQAGDAEISPYGLALKADVDRMVTTNSGHGWLPTMKQMTDGYTVQVWRAKDLNLLRTIKFPTGSRGNENAAPYEPRFAHARGSQTVFINSVVGSALYVSTDIASANPGKTGAARPHGMIFLP